MRVIFAALILIVLPSFASSTPKPKLTCDLRNVGIVISEKGKVREEDDWYADCRIYVDGKEVFSGALVLAHPASIYDATSAIDDLRKKKLVEIESGLEKK